MNGSIFRSAVKGADGEVDAGYLALFWIMVAVITAIPLLLVVATVKMVLDAAHSFDVQAIGIGIGSVCTGFGVAVGAVGAFRMGDKPHPSVAPSVAPDLLPSVLPPLSLTPYARRKKAKARR
jgi:hypothetical protein